MTTDETFFRCADLLIEEYPEFDRLPDGQKEGRLFRLKKLCAMIPDEVLVKAIAQHVLTSKWFPRTSELVTLVLEIAHPTQPAIEAWGEVQGLIERMRRGEGIGDDWAYFIANGEHLEETPSENQITNEAIRTIGGLKNLRDEMFCVANRARFIEAYNAIVTRERNKVISLPGFGLALLYSPDVFLLPAAEER